MAIFNSYVSLPEGIFQAPNFHPAYGKMRRLYMTYLGELLQDFQPGRRQKCGL